MDEHTVGQHVAYVRKALAIANRHLLVKLGGVGKICYVDMVNHANSFLLSP